MAKNIDQFLTPSEHSSEDHSSIGGVTTAAPSFVTNGSVSPVSTLDHKVTTPIFCCPFGGLATDLAVKLTSAGVHTFVIKVAGAPVATVVTPAGPGTFLIPIGSPGVIPPGGDVEVDYTAGPGPTTLDVTILIRGLIQLGLIQLG